jgi:uncharacterized protein YraI
MKLTHLMKVAGLGTAIVALTAGATFAAVATSSVNVRTGPGTSYGVVDTLQRGESVDITDRAGSWCEVDKSGPNGWVACNYLVSSAGYSDDEYTSDDDFYYDDQPSVSIGLGFGSRPVPNRPHHPVYPWWNDRPGTSFGFSYSN